ncbi:FAD-binding oxidoreductase [Patescibacteria group bacterium]|nr:FAD-binding oxidoreductase [Patescibacteria group bacterium]
MTKLQGIPPPNGGKNRVIVIGAGMTGATCAHELAHAGFNVVVLDKGAVGNGSSTRSAACIRTQFGTRENVKAMRAAVGYFVDFPGIMGIPDIPSNRAIVQNGYLYPFWVTDLAAFQAAQELALRMHEWSHDTVEVLDKQQTISRFPHLNPERLLGSRFCGMDGFLNVSVILDETFRHCREEHQVVLRTGVEVTSFILKKHTVQGVETSQGRIEADLVVNCTNIWSPRLTQWLPRSNGGMPKVMPVKRYLYMLKVAGVNSDEFERWPMTVFPSGCYCRPDGGNLMIGWAHQAQVEQDFRDTDQDMIEEAFNPKTGGEHNYGQHAIFEASRHVPAIMEMGEPRVTCGYYGVTPDHQPFISYDEDYARLIHAIGFSGHGAMFSPVTGKFVAMLAQANETMRWAGIRGDVLGLKPFSLSRSFGAGEHMVI